jgi:hypothetical protein
MIWLFERGEQALKLETRYDRTRKEYTIAITRPDSTTETERYSIFAEFHARVLALEHELETDRWRQMGPPSAIPGDWRGP